jgi:hypothetical protein
MMYLYIGRANSNLDANKKLAKTRNGDSRLTSTMIIIDAHKTESHPMELLT